MELFTSYGACINVLHILPLTVFEFPPPWGRIMTITAREHDSCGQYGCRSTNRRTRRSSDHATLQKKYRQTSLRRAKWNGMSSLWQDFPSRRTSPSRASQNIRINFTADGQSTLIAKELKKCTFIALMVYWRCSSILQLHHSNLGIISPDCHACSLLITAPDVSAMINYRTWTFGGRGEGGETAAKSSSSAIRFLTKPMKHAGNLQNISEQNLHEVSFHRYSGVQMTKNMYEAYGKHGRQKGFLQGSEAEIWKSPPGRQA
jgi:hypothetical protein